MRISVSLLALGCATATAVIVGCSAGGSRSTEPIPMPPQAGTRVPNSRPDLLNSSRALNSKGHTHRHFVSHYACPAKGSIKYISDDYNAVIFVYAGPFADQEPCGVIADAAVTVPEGLYIKNGTHDLYVANGDNVLVFHRGKTAPYNTYIDPTDQSVYDVTVAKDGTIIASNRSQQHLTENGSLSTWIGGPHGGQFVGNFPMTNDLEGLWVTVRKNGRVYYNDLDNSDTGTLWSLSCPAGVCGAQTQLAGVVFGFPGGMAIDAADNLLVNDQLAWTADTFKLPNRHPSTFPVDGAPVGMAINKLDNHWYIVDGSHDEADEYLYPSGKRVGRLECFKKCEFEGVAVDP